jgi:hypothetical protein
VGTDKEGADQHAPGMPAGGLRRLSQRYADGLLSETGYRQARRSFIERVVAGLGSSGDPPEADHDEHPFEATQPLPRTLLRRYRRRWLSRLLAAVLLLVLLSSAALFLLLRA